MDDVSGCSDAVLAWVASVVGRVPVDVVSLRGEGGPWLVRFDGVDELVLKVADERHLVAAEVSALEVVSGVGAPRVVDAELSGGLDGVFAVISTVLPGSSRIPVEVDVTRLRAVGAGAARLAKWVVAATEDLPVRLRSIEDVDFAAERRRRGMSELWTEAEELVAQVSVPRASSVLVHGDLWQGNTLWVGDVLSGFVDWDAAGVGSSGIDLGSARCDAEMLFGAGAADLVLEGWEAEAGTAAEDVAYWDVVAALCTPPDLEMWLPNMHEQGREDLVVSVLGERRDAFLRAALRAST